MKSLRYREALSVDEADHDPTPEEQRIWCPYCGGSGDEEWFTNQVHPNPFDPSGDEE